MLMPLAPWRSPLARALHRNRSRANSRYPQLATVRPGGRPANRTVVFRDFLAETNSLLFITDRRSKKIDQLANNAQAELCWYFTETREQFRIGGEIVVLTAAQADEAIAGKSAAEIRRETWANLSDKSRQQFSWPQPGEPRVTEGYEVTELDEQSPLKTFAVLVFEPDEVDHLELRGDPQNRYRYWHQGDGTWQFLAVNP